MALGQCTYVLVLTWLPFVFLIYKNKKNPTQTDLNHLSSVFEAQKEKEKKKSSFTREANGIHRKSNTGGAEHESQSGLLVAQEISYKSRWIKHTEA